jgi:hypothetical protein
MTFKEFRAWLAGYSESIDGVPTLEQWQKIKAEIAGIEKEQVKPPAFNKSHYWTITPITQSDYVE